MQRTGLSLRADREPDNVYEDIFRRLFATGLNRRALLAIEPGVPTVQHEFAHLYRDVPFPQ